MLGCENMGSVKRGKNPKEPTICFRTCNRQIQRTNYMARFELDDTYGTHEAMQSQEQELGAMCSLEGV